MIKGNQDLWGCKLSMRRVQKVTACSNSHVSGPDKVTEQTQVNSLQGALAYKTRLSGSQNLQRASKMLLVLKWLTYFAVHKEHLSF